MTLEIPPERVPERGRSPATALAVVAVVALAIVGFALVGRSTAPPPPAFSPPAALATPTARPSPTRRPAFATPTPAAQCAVPRLAAFEAPIPRHPRPLAATGVEILSPWAGADAPLVTDRDGGFWALGAGRLTRLDASGAPTASWTFADDPVFGSGGMSAARAGGVWLWGGPAIAWFDGERLRDVVPVPGRAAGDAWITDVAEAIDGALWAAVNGSWASPNEAQEGRVFRWDGRSWTDACLPGRGEISRLAVDAAGDVWVAPGAGTGEVARFDGSSWSVPPSDPAWAAEPARRDAWVSGLVAAGDGSVWLAAGGLARFDGTEWTSVRAGAVDLSGTVALVVAPDGTAWAATGSRIYPGDSDGRHTGTAVASFDGRSWTVHGGDRGLPSPEAGSWATITAVAASADAVVAATRDGFYRLAGDRWLRAGPPPAAGAPSWAETLLAVSADEAWATSWDTGLWHLRDGIWTRVPVAGWEPPLRVFGVARAPDGALAVATERGAALLRSGRWTILGQVEAHAVTFARDGTIWVAEQASQGSSGGDETTVASYSFDGRAWVRSALPSVTDTGWSARLVVAPDGEPWLHAWGWVGSLRRFDGTSWVDASPLGVSQASVAGLALDPAGELWALVGSGQADWAVAHRGGTAWTVDRAADGLAEPGNLTGPGGFAIAPDGTAWVATDRGLVRFDGRWTSFFAGQSWGAVSFAPDGTLFIVGPSGVQRVAPDRLAGLEPAPVTAAPADVTSPRLSLPRDIVVDRLTPRGTFVAYGTSAADEVDGPVPVVCARASGSVFPPGRTTVECVARDSAGNAARGWFTVDVRGAARPPGGTSCAPPAPGPTAWWTGDRTVADRAGGRDAVLRGDAGFGPGLRGDAFVLDGAGNFVEVADAPSLDVGKRPFTVSLWVRFDDTAGEQVLVEKWTQRYDEPSSGWTLTKLADGVIRLALGSRIEVDSPPLALAPSTWYHVAARRGDADATVFVDGFKVAASSGWAARSWDLATGSSLKLGHRGGPGDTPGSQDRDGSFLDGAIDEVQLYVGTALADDEIVDLFVAGTAGTCTGE